MAGTASAVVLPLWVGPDHGHRLGRLGGQHGAGRRRPSGRAEHQPAPAPSGPATTSGAQVARASPSGRPARGVGRRPAPAWPRRPPARTAEARPPVRARPRGRDRRRPASAGRAARRTATDGQRRRPARATRTPHGQVGEAGHRGRPSRASVSTRARSSGPSRCWTRKARRPTFHRATPRRSWGRSSASVADRTSSSAAPADLARGLGVDDPGLGVRQQALGQPDLLGAGRARPRSGPRAGGATAMLATP